MSDNSLVLSYLAVKPPPGGFSPAAAAQRAAARVEGTGAIFPAARGPPAPPQRAAGGPRGQPPFCCDRAREAGSAAACGTGVGPAGPHPSAVAARFAVGLSCTKCLVLN